MRNQYQQMVINNSKMYIHTINTIHTCEQISKQLLTWCGIGHFTSSALVRPVYFPEYLATGIITMLFSGPKFWKIQLPTQFVLHFFLKKYIGENSNGNKR
jgi:hypothetical protein